MELRCFVAVGIPAAIRAEIGKASDMLKEAGADVRWVVPDNIHITLKFLGRTEPARVGPITESLAQAVASQEPFPLGITGSGCFPDARNPRVVWIGITGPDTLASLQADVERAMGNLGYPLEDRPFSPHLTIGRVRSKRGMHEMLRRLDSLRTRNFGGFTVRSIALMESVLKPSGAEYFSLAEIPLGHRRNGIE